MLLIFLCLITNVLATFDFEIYQQEIKQRLNTLPTLADAERLFLKSGVRNGAEFNRKFQSWLKQCRDSFFDDSSLSWKQLKWYQNCVIKPFNILTFDDLKNHFKQMAAEMNSFIDKLPPSSGKVCMLISSSLEYGRFKSEDWFAYILTQEFGVNVDCFIDFNPLDRSKLPKPGLIRHVFIVDDTSYSGNQLFSKILSIVMSDSAITFGIYMPRMSRFAYEYVTSKTINLQIDYYSKMKIVEGMSEECVNSLQIKSTNADFRRSKLNETGLMAMQYKIPDFMSLDSNLGSCLRKKLDHLLVGQVKKSPLWRKGDEIIVYRLGEILKDG